MPYSRYPFHRGKISYFKALPHMGGLRGPWAVARISAGLPGKILIIIPAC